jgi:hypothetical protein
MAKDMMGHELAEGDFVHVDMPTHVFGYVKKIQQGGTVIATGLKVGGQRVDQVQPGIVMIEVMAQVTFDPRSGVCIQVIKCIDPEGEKKDSKPKLVV